MSVTMKTKTRLNNNKTNQEKVIVTCSFGGPKLDFKFGLSLSK